ncbi:DUF4870 domain-containing protein [bacterium]|nr:DUF4870 domain-containing protein [bacterium]
MPERDTNSLPLMRPEDRGLAVLSHLSTVVPVWALVANALLYFLCREGSRAAGFHARQGITFQLLFLMAVIPMLFLYLLSDLLGVILESLAPTLAGSVQIGTDHFATAMLTLTATAYGICCCIGVIQALRGRFFVYPLAGKRIFEDYIRTIREQAGGAEGKTG